jgi:hypothetical protein
VPPKEKPSVSIYSSIYLTQITIYLFP